MIADPKKYNGSKLNGQQALTSGGNEGDIFITNTIQVRPTPAFRWSAQTEK